MSDPLLKALIASGDVTDPASAKGRVLSAAAQLFNSEGYASTTVRKIATETGIQSGSLFHHFPSKQAILAAVMGETISLISLRMQQAADTASTPEEQLRALIRCELEAVLKDTGVAMQVLFFEWSSLEPEHQKRLLSHRNIYEQIWLDTLKQARKAGIIQQKPAILRRLILGAIAWTPNWYKTKGPLSLDALAEEIFTLCQ